MCYLMVRSFLFKTSDLANGASAVHCVMKAFYIKHCNIFGGQFEAFLDANDALPTNAGPCGGRITLKLYHSQVPTISFRTMKVFVYGLLAVGMRHYGNSELSWGKVYYLQRDRNNPMIRMLLP